MTFGLALVHGPRIGDGGLCTMGYNIVTETILVPTVIKTVRVFEFGAGVAVSVVSFPASFLLANV